MRRGRTKKENVRYRKCVVCGRRFRTARGHTMTCGGKCRTARSRERKMIAVKLAETQKPKRSKRDKDKSAQASGALAM